MLPKKSTLPGFTIVEILVVIAVLAVLMVITLIAINPSDQLAKSRNTKRAAGVEALANAIQQYTTDQRGILPNGITTTAQPISSSAVDLCELLTPEYIVALPQDPENGDRVMNTECGDYDTGFTIQALEQGHFVVAAPLAELEKTITETR